MQIFAQINPPKIVKQQRISNPFRDLDPNPLNASEDWLFATIEDFDDKSFVSCGFTDGTSSYSSGGSWHPDDKKPSIVKVSQSLGFLWRFDLQATDVIYDQNNVIWDPWFASSSRCSDIVQVGNYYYALAFLRLKRTTSPFDLISEQTILIKLDKEGNLQTGFPKVFNIGGWVGTNNNNSFRGNGLTYDYSNNFLYMVGSASYNSFTSVWAAKIEMNNYTISSQTDFGAIEGSLKAVCPIYYGGGNYNELPIINNQAPSQLAYCGRIKDFSNGFADALIIRSDLDFSNHTSITRDAPTSGYNNNYQRGIGGVNSCPSQTVNRNSADEASSIQQLKNGNLAIGVKYNVTLLDGWGFANPTNTNKLCTNMIYGLKREQIIDCDAFLMIIDKGFVSNTVDTKHDHVAHLNGDDFEFNITQDFSGDNILGIGTTADTFRLVQNNDMDNYWIFKYNLSSGSILWEKSFQGCSKSRICAFDLTPTFNGGILAVGNNYLVGENYDWLLLGRDCETNITPQAFDLEPNMPDGKTFSVQQFLTNINSPNTTLNMFNSRTILAQIRIENGYTLRLNQGCNLKMPNPTHFFDSSFSSDLKYSIIVEAGGMLRMENQTSISSYDGCGNTTWGGIKLSENTMGGVQNGGRLEMHESLLENAGTAVTSLSGSVVIVENTPVTNGRTSTINFKNNRKSIEFHPWFQSSNATYLKYANFLCDASINDRDGIGMNSFVSAWDYKNLNIWGCSFRNLYVGNFKDNKRGVGIGSFNLSLNLIKGSNLTTTNGQCSYPIGNTNLFEGLDVGFWNGGNTSSNVVKIYGNEFKNVANPIFAGTGSNLKLYDNDLYWDNNFIQPPSLHPNYWVKGIHTGVHDGLNFDQNRINARAYIYPYTGMFLENVSNPLYPSVVFNNTTWNNPGTGLFGTAMFNSSSNTALDFTCNTYQNMLQDWYLGGSFRSQVGGVGILGSNNKWTKPSFGQNNIFKTIGNLEYFCFDPNNSNLIHNPNSIRFSINVDREDHQLQERDCNNTSPCLKYNYSLENGGEHTGQMLVLFNQEYQQALDALNHNNFELARTKTNAISAEIDNTNKKTLLNILIPIFEQHRQYEMTASEIQNLTALTEGTAHENEYARNVLSFFADKTFMPIYTPMLKSNEAAFSNTEIKTNIQDIFMVYPNPSNSSITIQLPNNITNEITSITITNMMGIKVYENVNYNSNTPIDISAFANGMYLVSVFNKAHLVYSTIVSKL